MIRRVSYLFKCSIFFTILVALTAPPAVPAEPVSDDFKEKATFVMAVEDISLGSVLEMNRSIQAGVESGDLSQRQGRKARDLTLDLRRYLSGLDVEISEAEDTILAADDRTRLKAIRHYSRLVARRERALVGAWFALREIGGDMELSESDTTGQPERDDEAVNDRKGLDVKIKLIPEDRLMEDLE